MVYTTRFAGGRGGRNQLRSTSYAATTSCRRTAAPNHPRHQRQGRTLPADDEEVATRRSPTSPATLAELQALLDASSATSTTTAAATRRCHTARPRPPPTPPDPKPAPATPTAPPTPTTASAATRSTRPGSVTLRVAGQLRHIAVGRTHARTHVLLLVHDLDVRIINAATGETPPRAHHRPHPRLPTHRRPPGPTRRNDPDLRNRGSGYSDVLRHHTVGLQQDLNLRPLDPQPSAAGPLKSTRIRIPLFYWAFVTGGRTWTYQTPTIR